MLEGLLLDARDILETKLAVILHGLERLLGLEFVCRQKLHDYLLILPELSIVLDFLFTDILIELLQLALLILVVLYLAVEEETGTFFVERCLLFGFWVRERRTCGEEAVC